MTKKFKLPDKLKIGGFDYKVILKDRLKDNEKDIGLCICDSLEILIARYNAGYEYSPSKIIQTLLHEIFHAIDFVYCDEQLEESAVRKLETLWFAVLVDNNLYINSNKFPNSIKILGQTYTIDYLHKYENGMESTLISARIPDLKILIDKNKVHDDIIKMRLLFCVTGILLSEVDFKEDEEFSTLAFSQGLYQVLKDNKLEAFIHRWCK